MNNYLINLLGCISYFTFFYIFFSELHYRKLTSILLIMIESCFTYICSVYTGCPGNQSIPYDIFYTLIILLFQLIIFDDHRHSKTALIAIFVLFLNLLNSLFTSILTMAFIPFLHISLSTDAAAGLLQMISLYVFYIFAKYLHSRKAIINTSVLSDFFMILFIPFLMSCSIQYLYYQYRTFELLRLLFLNILLDTFMIIILVKKIHDLETIHHEQIASAILAKTEEQFQSMIINENRIRKIRHDMKNHLAVIHSLCSSQKFNEISDYINKLTESVNIGQIRIYCDNLYLNTMLNSKTEQYKDIQFSFLLLSLPSGIDDIDLCILTANLIDNAITELCNHTELSKNITLKMYATGNFQFIVIQNPLSQLKTLITEKSDMSNHGLGLSIVQEIVDKYNGELLIQQNDLFTVTVMFYSPISHESKTENQ